MNRKRRYYVIYENDQWKIKLEKGSVIQTFGSNYRTAIKRAKQLGSNNNRPVMVNGKDGETGVRYYDQTEL